MESVFHPVETDVVGFLPGGLIANDLDGDGKVDLAVDVDGDGEADIVGFQLFIPFNLDPQGRRKRRVWGACRL